MTQLGLKDLSRNYTQGYEIGFVSYPYLILLISSQMFKPRLITKIFHALQLEMATDRVSYG